jgi:hypothetical protein
VLACLSCHPLNSRAASQPAVAAAAGCADGGRLFAVGRRRRRPTIRRLRRRRPTIRPSLCPSAPSPPPPHPRAAAPRQRAHALVWRRAGGGGGGDGPSAANAAAGGGRGLAYAAAVVADAWVGMADRSDLRGAHKSCYKESHHIILCNTLPSALRTILRGAIGCVPNACRDTYTVTDTDK